MMELVETNYQDLKSNELDSLVRVTLVYTPTCGTCQLAKKMIEVLQEAIPNVVFTKINLNLNESLARDYEILSIPCLLIHQNLTLVDKIYKFQSVPYLYELIKTYI